MKKICTSLFLGVILFVSIGSTGVEAAEVFPHSNDVEVQGIQARSGYINGVFYRLRLRTGTTRPPQYFYGMRLILVQLDNGVYWGYYR